MSRVTLALLLFSIASPQRAWRGETLTRDQGSYMLDLDRLEKSVFWQMGANKLANRDAPNGSITSLASVAWRALASVVSYTDKRASHFSSLDKQPIRQVLSAQHR